MEMALMAQGDARGAFDISRAAESLRRFSQDDNRRLLAANSSDGIIGGFLCGQTASDLSGDGIAVAPLVCSRFGINSANHKVILNNLAHQFCEWAAEKNARAVYLVLSQGTDASDIPLFLSPPIFRIYARRKIQSDDLDDGAKPRLIRCADENPPKGAEYLTPQQAFPQAWMEDKSELSCRQISQGDFARASAIIKANRPDYMLPFCADAFAKWIDDALVKKHICGFVCENNDGELVGVMGGFSCRHPFASGELAMAIFIHWSEREGDSLRPPKECRLIRNSLMREFFRWSENAREIHLVVPSGESFWPRFAREWGFGLENVVFRTIASPGEKI